MMPFAVTGSLINFCDCLLSGGTSRNNHSEVGSSYVHFNYTPHQDKATPSLLGDVPRGVMLDQPPIFLGGQGGLVGPSRVEFGTTIAAGTVFRRDVTRQGLLVFGDPGRTHSETPYNPQVYGNIHRILENNFIYLGNLFALLEWYHHVRSPFLTGSPHGQFCHTGAIARIRSGIAERVKRLSELACKLENSLKTARSFSRIDTTCSPYKLHRDFVEAWPKIREQLLSEEVGDVAASDRDALLTAIRSAGGCTTYIDAIKGLRSEDKTRGSAWLSAIVDRTVNRGTL